MADLRISDLPALAQADAESTDDLPIIDVSAAETKRITAKALVQQAVTNLIDDGAIPVSYNHLRAHETPELFNFSVPL